MGLRVSRSGSSLRVPCPIPVLKMSTYTSDVSSPLGRPADRPRPSTSLRCCSCDGGRKLLKCCPQRARRRLPLGGRLACIRIRRRPADEHACRPNSCRLVLGEHTSIAARQPSQQEQRVAHERGTSASSFAIVRLHVTSGYPYASVVCMGPGYGPLSVYGRCVVLILLVGVSTKYFK